MRLATGARYIAHDQNAKLKSAPETVPGQYYDKFSMLCVNPLTKRNS